MSINWDGLLERFEGARSIGYLSVFGGIFSGPVAAIALIRPRIFIDLDLLKLTLLAGCIGGPVMAFIGAAMIASEAFSSITGKPSLNKLAPGILATTGYMSMISQGVALLFSGRNPQNYLLMLSITTFVAAAAFIGGGLCERYGKKKRLAKNEVLRNIEN
ncbi:hypothetical protein [Xanthomonas arboricola]